MIIKGKMQTQQTASSGQHMQQGCVLHGTQQFCQVGKAKGVQEVQES